MCKDLHGCPPSDLINTLVISLIYRSFSFQFIIYMCDGALLLILDFFLQITEFKCFWCIVWSDLHVFLVYIKRDEYLSKLLVDELWESSDLLCAFFFVFCISFIISFGQTWTLKLRFVCLFLYLIYIFIRETMNPKSSYI